MPPISDQRGHMVADSSKRAFSPVVDKDGFQQVMPRRRVKASVGSAKATQCFESQAKARGRFCRPFRFLNLNARTVANKAVELEGVLLAFNPDVEIITETWLHDQIPDNDVFPHGFKVFRRDRGSRGGGVALLIKDTIPCMSIEHGQDCEMVWASIRFGCQSMLVGAVYRCLQASIDVIQSLSEFLLTKTKQFSRIVMAGDFNLPDIDWNCVMPNGICNQSRLLVDIAFSNNLSQVVKCPTRVSNDRESLLDLVFLSEVVTRSILDVSIADGISDHAIVVCDLSAPQHAHNETEVKSYRDFNRANDIDIIDFLEVALDRFLAFYDANPD
ncbi:uncharacterized protein LOC115310035 [Ixodes scapularis]|uniref:uncharacterized protein LOC115310035 n=1 Tax=Ixodes scapularis TaxID=6945 RepID=UPI001A9FD3FA|nr:uncharacterized protein LOC115310035 [Ixodes scapularis]